MSNNAALGEDWFDGGRAGQAPLVSVIIVNFNGIGFLDDCIDTLKNAFKKYSSEIIVVDNASTDGSREFLRQSKGIRLIELEKNCGFARGNNVGANQARGAFLLLLNNDTKCLTDLDGFIEMMGDGKLGACGCALAYADGRLQLSVGYEHSPLRIVMSWIGLAGSGKGKSIFSRMVRDPDFYLRRQHDVDWVSGASLLTRSDVWRRLGGFDEAIFMYCEDVDYCKRVRQLGYEVAFCPDVRVLHHEGAGKAWIGSNALQQTARSYLTYVAKHHGGLSRFGVALSLATVFMLRAFAYRIAAGIKGDNAIESEKFSAYVNVSAFLLRQSIAARAVKMDSR